MISPFLCRLLNSEEAMESGLKMTKPFLVFTFLLTVGLSQSVEQSTKIDKQSLSTFLTNLKQTMKIAIKMSNTLDTQVEKLLAMVQRFEKESSK